MKKTLRRQNIESGAPICLFEEGNGTHLTESDTDTQIRRFWASRLRLISEEVLQKLEERFPEFRDALEDSPVRAAEFLCHLELEPVRNFLNGLYRRKPTYPSEAMLRSLFLMDLRRMKFRTELKRDLDSNPDEARMLGFPVEDGHVLVTAAKNLWHFDRIRIGDRRDDLFDMLRDAVVAEAGSLDIRLGEKTLEDATPIESLDGDGEAEYNGHYEVKGYKLDTVTDLEEAVPLSKKVTGINEDEAKNLQPHMSEMKEAGMEVKDHWFDGGYADYVNLAWMGVNGIEAHYHLHENWVRNFNMGFRPQGGEPIIRKNTIQMNSYGVKVSGVDVTVDNNTIVDNIEGVHVSETCSPIISGNDIMQVSSQTSYGIVAAGGTPEIRWNNISNIRVAGIQVVGGNPDIVHNTIYSYIWPTARGISIEGGNATIKNGNNVHHNYHGIYVSTSYAPWIKDNNTIHNNTQAGIYLSSSVGTFNGQIWWNDIVDNGKGIEAQNPTSGVYFHAECNWWDGTSSSPPYNLGPYDPSPLPPSQNLYGTGQPVSDYFYYRSWLIGPSDIPTSTCTGT